MAWQTAGYLAGRGIQKAVSGAAANARIRQAMNPAGAMIPPVLLDIDRVVTDGYFFQLGVPWGWRDLSPAEVAHSAAMLGLPVVAGVLAERADEDWAGMLVSPFQLDGSGIWSLIIDAEQLHQARYSKMQSGHPLGSPSRILLDGEVGVIFHYGLDVPGESRGYPSVAAVPAIATECYIARRGQGFRIEFNAGYRHHERYLPCLWTMFGSWRWIQ